MSVVAEWAFTSRGTVQRVEAGDPSVGAVIYAAVVQALGLLDGLAGLASPARDVIGLALANAELPRRARIRERRPATTPDE